MKRIVKIVRYDNFGCLVDYLSILKASIQKDNKIHRDSSKVREKGAKLNST